MPPLKKRKTEANLGLNLASLKKLQALFRSCFSPGAGPLTVSPIHSAIEHHEAMPGQVVAVQGAGTFHHQPLSALNVPGNSHFQSEGGHFAAGHSCVAGSDVRMGCCYAVAVASDDGDVRMGQGTVPQADTVRLAVVVGFGATGRGVEPTVYVLWLYRLSDKEWLSGSNSHRLRPDGRWPLHGIRCHQFATDEQAWSLADSDAALSGIRPKVEPVIMGTTIGQLPLGCILGPRDLSHTADHEGPVMEAWASFGDERHCQYVWSKIVDDSPQGDCHLAVYLPNADHAIQDGARRAVDVSTEGGLSNFHLNLRAPIALWYKAIQPGLVLTGNDHRQTIAGVGFTLFCLLAQHHSCVRTTHTTRRAWTARWATWASLADALQVRVVCKPPVNVAGGAGAVAPWVMEVQYGIALDYSHDLPGQVSIFLSPGQACLGIGFRPT